MYKFPDAIRKLPQANIPKEGVTGFLHQAEHSQILFLEFDQDTILDPHQHEVEYGVVVDGTVDITIDGVKYSYTKGDVFYIPRQTEHSVLFHAGFRCVNFFDEASRYQTK